MYVLYFFVTQGHIGKKSRRYGDFSKHTCTQFKGIDNYAGILASWQLAKLFKGLGEEKRMKSFAS